jgi:hypothetical protein
MKLTQPVLKAIAYQLHSGNPWWGLLLTNEYLLPDSPLHTSLCALFRKRVPDRSVLAERLLSGARCKDLSAEQRAHIGTRASPHTALSVALPRALPVARLPRHRRLPPPRARNVSLTLFKVEARHNSKRLNGKPIEMVLNAAPALRTI